MAYTKGSDKDFLRGGEFRFNIGEKEQKIQVYKSGPVEEKLLILFRDGTSGNEHMVRGVIPSLNPRKIRLRMGNGFSFKVVSVMVALLMHRFVLLENTCKRYFLIFIIAGVCRNFWYEKFKFLYFKIYYYLLFFTVVYSS